MSNLWYTRSLLFHTPTDIFAHLFKHSLIYSFVLFRVNNGDFETLRFLKQGNPSRTSKKVATSTVTQISATNSYSTNLVTNEPEFAPQGHHNSIPSTSKSNFDDVASSRHNSRLLPVSKATSSTTQSHLSDPTSWSHSRLGTKRKFADLNFDDNLIDRKPVKCKPEVIDLCDSQDDDLVAQPSFNTGLTSKYEKANTMPAHDSFPDVKYDVQATNQNSQRDVKYDIQATNQNSQRNVKYETQPTNHNAQTDVNQDEEAKIMSIRDVMPDASLDDILRVLSSCAGNVEYAVAKLLDEMSN